MTRIPAALALTLLGLTACAGDAPTVPDASSEPALAARGGSQTLYTFTFDSGILADPTHPFATLANTGDPFFGTPSGNPVYLTVPASSAGNAAVCHADGSGLGATTTNWGGYVGIWKGEIRISAKGGKSQFWYRGTREDGSGLLYLVVNDPAVKSNNNLTLTFTNARGLVSAFSMPDGGPFDPQDRCLTFSIVATP